MHRRDRHRGAASDEQGCREGNPSLTLRRNGHRGQNRLEFPALERRDDAVERRYDLHAFDVQPAAYFIAEVDAEADQLSGRCPRLERRVSRIDAEAKLRRIACIGVNTERGEQQCQTSNRVFRERSRSQRTAAFTVARLARRDATVGLTGEKTPASGWNRPWPSLETQKMANRGVFPRHR